MYKTGEIVKGTITGIKNYGIFVKIGTSDGLVHISEFSDGFVSNINEIFNIGEDITLKVLGLEKETGKLRLSFKQANNLHLRLKKEGNIQIGFKSLEENLDFWISQANQKFK